jgi:ribonuclease-3
LLANALEALIAALHLDGGLGAARLFVEGHILNVSLQAIEAAATPLNAKGALIELAHSCGLPLPRYTVVGQSGPEHERLFTVEVRLGSDVSACAEGSTRKQASKAAAQKVLDRLISELKQNAAPGADSGSVDA